MGKILIIKDVDFSNVAIGDSPTITISSTGSVTIVDSSAEAIYYTTDGSTPTTSSMQYSSAFQILSGITVKAISTYSDGSTSNVISKKYEGSTTEYNWDNATVLRTSILSNETGYTDQGSSGVRIRLWWKVDSPCTVSVNTSFGAGALASVYDNLIDALTLAGAGPGTHGGTDYESLPTKPASYASSFSGSFTMSGYISVSLKKADGSAISDAELADAKSKTTISIKLS